jgi:hypothetical protein
MEDDAITTRLRVAQTLIHQCLSNLRELSNVVAVDAHDRGIVSQESFEAVEPSLKELDLLLTRGLELFEPEDPPLA